MCGLRRWLIEPGVRGVDADSAEFTAAHRRVLQTKFMLRQLFEKFYHECRAMDIHYFGDCPGTRLEIGSGSSFIKEVYPDVITSDIKQLPFVDCVLRAEQMPFPDNSLRAIYAINVFHHIPDPRAFFRELLRTLHPGGGVIFIEPYYGALARQLFRRMHASEGFDITARNWEALSGAGPMSQANQALSYMVFKRDLTQFEREYPGLELMMDRPHTHLSYLVSGGVNFRQLVPDSLVPLVMLAERLLNPFVLWLALQHTIVLCKK